MSEAENRAQNRDREAARKREQNEAKSGQQDSSRGRERNGSQREQEGSFSVSRTANRVLEAARRNPEALVILAAGAAMLLRRSNVYGGSSGSSDGRGRNGEDRDGGSIAGAAGDYVTDAAGRVVDTAGAYVSSVGEFAEDGTRIVTRQATRLAGRIQSGAERMLQGQPVTVAAFGLATGAVVAAVLPRSEVEQRALLPARDALAGVASRAVETARETAEHRLSPEGLREIAGEAAKIVTQAVIGKGDRSDDEDDDRRRG